MSGKERSESARSDLILQSKESTDGSKSPKKVYVRTIFTKMGEIDTAKECFTAEVIIQAKWREELLDGAAEEDIKRVNYDQLWNPKLSVSNLITEQKELTSYATIFPNDDRLAFVFLQKKLKGCFMENLELQEFPFDIQDVTVTLTSELTCDKIELLDERESMVNTHSFVDEQEWKLRSDVRVESGETEDMVFGGRSVGRKFPYLNFKCTAERRYQYFMWNFVFILIFIGLMCLAIFSVEHKFPQNRLQLTFILLLTTVAFRSNINSTLPKISYLTYMDIYFLGSWVIQCLMCTWHAVVGSLLIGHPNVVEVDRGVLIGFSVLVLSFQAFCACFAYKKLKKKQGRIDNLSTTQKSGMRNTMDEEMRLSTTSVPKYSALKDTATTNNNN